MQNIFEELFIENEEFEIDEDVQKRFAESLDYLINDCDKTVRSHTMQIVDSKDLICHARAIESFKCGFWLARRLETQLTNYQKKRLQKHSMPVEDPLYFIEEE
ncbi:MAG: hypothetical protein R3Y35_05195 [Clostridia bacterium]